MHISPSEREQPLGTNDGLPLPPEIIPPHLPIPLDQHENAGNVEIEVPLEPEDQEVPLWLEDQDIPLKQENLKIVIISDDEDDKYVDPIIEDIGDSVDPMFTDSI